MAQQDITIGTANAGNGDSLFAAFTKVQANFTELYTDDAGDVGSITATAPIERDTATGAVTISLADLGVTSGKLAADSVITAKILDANVTTAKIADDGVTHAKLENRYKSQVAISTLTGTVAFDCSAGSSFKLSGDLTGTYTINLGSYKKGQMITIFPLKGNQTLNLAGQGSSTNTFNKIGGVDYNDDGSSSNILQIECVDDSATDPIFFYSLGTFVSASSDI